jgi:hypothetical protein
MGAKMAAVAPPTTKPKINVSDGELASQASRRIVDALGSRQPIRRQRLPQTSPAISHNAIDEPERRSKSNAPTGCDTPGEIKQESTQNSNPAITHYAR